MRILLCLFVALLSVSPVGATPTTNFERDPVAVVAEELGAYGQWLQSLDAIQGPVQAEFSAMGSEWQAALRADPDSGARFRSVVVRLTDSIDRTNAQLQGLETPDFPALELDEDLRPVNIVRTTAALNRQMRDVVQGFNPLLDAMESRDRAAADRASGRLVDSVALVIDSQILLTRASLAATPREEAAWQVVNIQLLYFRALGRVMAVSSHVLAAEPDPTLSDDLLALAAELEGSIDEADAKFDAELESWNDQLRDAEFRRDVHQADVLRRVITVSTIDRQILPVGRRLAAMLRERGEALRNRVISGPVFVALVQSFPPIRQEIDDIVRQENEALAGSDSTM